MSRTATSADEWVFPDSLTGSKFGNETFPETGIRGIEDIPTNEDAENRTQEQELVRQLKQEKMQTGTKRSEDEHEKPEEGCKILGEEHRRWEEKIIKWKEECWKMEDECKMREENCRKREEECKKREEECTKWEERVTKWEEECWEREEKVKGSVGISGHFNSRQVRHPSDLRSCDWKEINFHGNLNKVDAILTGLNLLDFDRVSYLRIKTYACQHGSSSTSSKNFKVALETWSNSKMYTSGCDWIALYLARHPDIQWGSFNTTEVYRPSRPQVSTTKVVTFARKYTKEEGIPNVAIWLNSVDMARNPKQFEFKTFVSDVTRKGFAININSSASTVLHSAGVNWISHPKGKKGIDSANFSTRKTVRAQNSDSGKINFNNRHIKHVFVALKEFVGDGCSYTRMKLVAKAGNEDSEVQWWAETWSDSVFHKAVGTIIVLE